MKGDPLSAYLFILCMEAFSRILFSVASKHKIHGMKVGKAGPRIHHLLSADDVLLFLKADHTELRYLQQLLATFGSSSVQVINLQKSAIFFSKNISRGESNQIANIMQMKFMGLGDKYLGILLLKHRSRIRNCKPLVDHMAIKLQGWQAKLLNSAARATWIQSMLNNMPVYHMHCLKLPQRSISQMNTMQRKY